jgi:hypothetical protein
MTLFSKYRIKEIREQGLFIPQVMKCFFNYESIDKKDTYTWISEKNAINHCSYKTLEEARKRIESYKEQTKKPTIIYHRA